MLRGLTQIPTLGLQTVKGLIGLPAKPIVTAPQQSPKGTPQTPTPSMLRLSAQLAGQMAKTVVSIAAESAIVRVKKSLGYNAQDSYPVMHDLDLFAKKILEMNQTGKRIVVFIGCGKEAAEVIRAATEANDSNTIYVGIESSAFDFKPSKTKLNNVLFLRHDWHSTLFVMTQSGASVDEIKFVAPFLGSHLLYELKDNSDFLLAYISSSVSTFSGDEIEAQLLYDALRDHGDLSVYTEQKKIIEYLIEFLAPYFGQNSIVINDQLPSQSAPPSSILQSYPTTFTLTAHKQAQEAKVAAK